MKKLKIVIIVIFSLLLSGCSIEYNLNFEDGDLKENINVFLEGSELNSDTINNLKAIKLLAISQGLEQIKYNTSFEESKDKFIAKYSYAYSIDDFLKNNVIRSCYDSFSLTQEDDYYLLSTGKTFKCLSLDYKHVDSYKISITTNHVVLENNADEVKDNTYIWYINNDNNGLEVTKPITIKFSKALVETPPIISLPMLIILLLVIVVIGAILLFIVNFKKKQNNKI